jgi:flagellar export protein FliJ
MARDLKGVIRFRKWELDEKRRALGELLRNEQGLIDALEKFEEEMVNEAKAATQNAVEGGITFGTYAVAAKARREQVELWLADVRQQIEIARDDLAQSFKEFKTFEIAQENRDREALKERESKAQKTLDEIALTIHRRKG